MSKLDNFVLDPNLSLKAKGLMFILIATGGNQRINFSEFVKLSKDGKDAQYNALKELIKNGYIERVPVRKNGRMNGYEYIIHIPAVAGGVENE